MSSTYDPIADSKAINLALYGPPESYKPVVKKWFWKCSACGINTQCEQSEAMALAENHDKESHKKKPTTRFGWEIFVPYRSNIPWSDWAVTHKADKNGAETRWQEFAVNVTEAKHFMGIQSEQELIFCGDDGIEIGKKIYTFLMGNGETVVSDHYSNSPLKSEDHIMKWAKRYCDVTNS